MRILIFGNSGSGKSVLAKRLAEADALPHLDLDSIVWEPNLIAIARKPEQVSADLQKYIATHPSWIIEWCYSELIQEALPFCTELIFMNPWLETCLANCRNRPWEPHKYASLEEQQKMLEPLLAWVESYYTREDPWSYNAHRKVFDSFLGNKKEITFQK